MLTQYAAVQSDCTMEWSVATKGQAAGHMLQNDDHSGLTPVTAHLFCSEKRFSTKQNNTVEEIIVNRIASGSNVQYSTGDLPVAAQTCKARSLKP